MKDMNVRFSTLWIFAMFNYIYADIHSLIDPTTQKEIMTGYIGSLPITQEFLLGSALLMRLRLLWFSSPISWSTGQIAGQT